MDASCAIYLQGRRRLAGSPKNATRYRRGPTRYAFCITFLLLILLSLVDCSIVLGWNGHETITLYALRNVPELSRFSRIMPKSYSYEDIDKDKYNPKFEIKYVAGEGMGPLSALQILTSYASEPDWDLDTGLSIHPLQALTGGSQGWRHQRYLLFNGLVRVGAAPQRAAHFYELSLEAYKRGDFYWAFRFLARALHYVQDCGQPLHSLPIPERDLISRYKLNMERVQNIGKNVHYNLEAFIRYHLNSRTPKLMQAIEGKNYPEIDDVRQAASELNEIARGYAERQYRLTIEIWPRLEENREINLGRGDFTGAGPKEKVDDLLDIVAKTLQETAYYSRGLIHKFFHDISQVGQGPSV